MRNAMIIKRLSAIIMAAAVIITCSIPQTAMADSSRPNYDMWYLYFDDPVKVTPGAIYSEKFDGLEDSDYYLFESGGGEYTFTFYCRTKYDSLPEVRNGSYSFNFPVFFRSITTLEKDGKVINGDAPASIGWLSPDPEKEAEDGWFQCTETIGTYDEGTLIGIELERLKIEDDDYVIGDSPFTGEYKIVINGKAVPEKKADTETSYKPAKARLSSVTAGKKAFTVKWKKTAMAAGYQLRYAGNKSFTKNVRTVNIKSGKMIKKTIRKLKKNKRYYIKLRAYRIVDGKKYYGPWSVRKSIKTK